MTGASIAIASLHATGLEGCLEASLRPHHDARGMFLKTYHEPTFRELGLGTDWREEFISTSIKGVIRGMHFQAPPHQHAKFVVCLSGRVLDVALDLRVRSGTYGRWIAVELAPEKANGLYIAEGFAHGFLALEEQSTLLYKVSTVHAPESDRGIRWDSFGFPWPVKAPVVSTRDTAFETFDDFQTPFRS